MTTIVGFSFQCSRLRLKGFGAASSVPRCRFASDGIFDRFYLLRFFFLTPDTRNLVTESHPTTTSHNPFFSNHQKSTKAPTTNAGTMTQ
jgi:hypothetical protein